MASLALDLGPGFSRPVLHHPTYLLSRHRQYQNFQPQYQYQKTHLGNTNTNTSQLVNHNTNTNTGKNLNTQYPIPIPQYQYILYSSFAIEKPNCYSWTNPCWWSHLPVSFATMLLLTLPDWRCMKGQIQKRSHLHVPSVKAFQQNCDLKKHEWTHRREAICLLKVDFSPYPWKYTMVTKPIIANNVTRNLASLFCRKSK